MNNKTLSPEVMAEMLVSLPIGRALDDMGVPPDSQVRAMLWVIVSQVVEDRARTTGKILDADAVALDVIPRVFETLTGAMDVAVDTAYITHADTLKSISEVKEKVQRLRDTQTLTDLANLDASKLPQA